MKSRLLGCYELLIGEKLRMLRSITVPASLRSSSLGPSTAYRSARLNNEEHLNREHPRCANLISNLLSFITVCLRVNTRCVR